MATTHPNATCIKIAFSNLNLGKNHSACVTKFLVGRAVAFTSS